MNYTINRTTQNVEVTFGEEVICKRIHENDDGKEFFAVPNLLHHPEDEKNRFFHYRVKDAIDTVRKGDGDAIEKIKPFGIDSIVRYLDRDYGEAVRSKFLKKWENAKFAHLVCIGNSLPLDIDGNINIQNPQLFETQENAESFLATIEEKMRKVADSLTYISESAVNAVLINSAYSHAEKKMFMQFAPDRPVESPFRIIQAILN